MCVAVCRTHKATKRKRRAIHEMEVLRKANKVVPAQEMAKERLAAELEELSKVHKKHHRRRPKAGRARVPLDKGGRLGTNMRWDRVAGHSGLGHGGGGGGSASIVNPTKQAWG
jgi:hypothetical protein